MICPTTKTRCACRAIYDCERQFDDEELPEEMREMSVEQMEKEESRYLDKQNARTINKENGNV